MFPDIKSYQHSFFSILLPSLLMVFASILTACNNQPSPDQPLTRNGMISGSATPGTVVTAQSKAVQPIEIVADQSHVSSYANGKMSLTIITSPYAICNFIVSYGMNTPSKAFGIRPVTADAHGLANWQWQVESKALTGIWPLQVTATPINGTQTKRSISVTVNLPPLRLDTTKSILNVTSKAVATLAIVTAPSTDCIMTMSYPTHPKTFKGTTDAHGTIRWTWRVEGSTNPGTYPLIVTITTGSGEQANATFSMVVL
ncbi:hypothetical protein KSF_019140 [Reticulibacter mediterranei]|uniref:Uncharacterized protein n=1 Tax=Reticulibacter mediterranei TaxID=2778369 RepID=A0A8J3ILS8_9CHLR|nr:hypothetical protein [Reticulibacter mediterranei]GHO91866.1 hypothetical protein KSF_019140 [Reticulibacter mediterranei]